MKRSVITSIVSILCAAGFSYNSASISTSGEVAGQRRGPRRTVQRAAPRKPAIDYSRFAHATKQHQGTCKSCHKAPTANWRKVSDFPDVADFPDHEACVACHRAQFFKGAQPIICSGCHQKTSPRDAERIAFRNFKPDDQFEIEFPHDKHQDVIASLQPPFPAVQTAGLRAWAHARRLDPGSQTTSVRYNNCEICHVGNANPPAKPSGGWIDGFTPAADSFKASPQTHASCFNCHWKGREPTKDNCAGCHKPAPPDRLTMILERKSLKFTHAREQHVKECTACHINITKASSLRGLKPDVPITSCTECHNKDGLRLDVNKELEAIDKNRDFVCTYCHTSDIGRRDPPASHYLIAGRTPVKRNSIK